MASTDGLVPITRSFLASYYDKYPFNPLSDDVSRLTSAVRSISANLEKEVPLTESEKSLLDELDRGAPHKMDENKWKNREHIEEIMFLLDGLISQFRSGGGDDDVSVASVFEEIKVKLGATLRSLEGFQSENSQRIFSTVMTYMPQDFRGSLIRQQRERSEKTKQAEVDTLVNSGGSIHDRYALLWKQQMERRQTLSQLGSATGVYKTLVKYLVGVPEVLLDFVRQINDDEGPMEEQRQRYGPPLYSLTTMVFTIRYLILLSSRRFETRKLTKSEVDVLRRATEAYTSELERFLKFISQIFANSPFFISAEEAGAMDTKKNDFTEIVIPAGKTHEVTLAVESVNSYIAWEFSLGQAKMDIGFSVECTDSSGGKSLILPYRRYESDQSNFSTCMAGSYKFIWDNSYSSFYKKALRFKVDCIPPVAETLQPVPEPEA